MEYILSVAVFFLLAIGLMYAVSSEGSNPTRQQMRNRIKMQRRWKRFKRTLKVDEVLAPFIGGLILIFFVLVFTFKLNGVIIGESKKFAIFSFPDGRTVKYEEDTILSNNLMILDIFSDRVYIKINDVEHSLDLNNNLIKTEG